MLKALRSLQFEQEERKYKFDDKGDINLGYDVLMWRSESGNIHVPNVVAEYHPVNSSFTYTSQSNRGQLMDLRVGHHTLTQTQTTSLCPKNSDSQP